MRGGEAQRGASTLAPWGWTVGGGPAHPGLVPAPGALGSCRGPEWALALMLQAENRMRAAKRHQGCLSGGETPQHGFMAKRLLGGGAVDQLSPIFTKGRQRRGPWPPWQQEGERLDTRGRHPDRHQRLEGPFSDHANPLSHWTAGETEARRKKQVLGQGHRVNEK